MSDDFRSVSKRFTHRLHLVLVSAAQLATQQGKKAITPHHLLYGLMNQQEFLISQFFPDAPAKGRATRVKTKPGAKPTAKDRSKYQSVALTGSSQKVLQYATKIANHYAHPSIDVLHLFASLVHYPHQDLKVILEKKKITPHELESHLMAWIEDLHSLAPVFDTLGPHHDHGDDPREKQSKKKQVPALELFATHLTDPAKASKLDPLIGRERELGRTMTILARRIKNNPLLVGEPGVGKTAIVEGLAKKIVLGDVPAPLRDKKLYALDITALMAGTTYRGELEVRCKQLMIEMMERRNVILFIDEIHTIVGGSGGGGTAADIGNILKPALARGLIRCIGATTFTEYKRYFEEDPALERRFQHIAVEQPSTTETEEIISGIVSMYERHHNVKITPAAVSSAVALSDRYLPEKFFPDKAIDLIDEAAALVHLRNPIVLTEEMAKNPLALPSLPKLEPADIAEVIATTTGIPLSAIATTDKERLRSLEERLSTAIIGQAHAKSAVAGYLRRAQCGLTPPGRPMASFAFLGPSGVGKTELAKAIAREALGPDCLIKLDMSEFSESFTISRLIGAPSGYVGFKEGGKLTEAIRRRPHSVVLFDEIEKAHPKVANILLQILEDGVLSDAAGKRVDFSNTIIILTSNLGAQYAGGVGRMGFSTGETVTHDTQDVMTGELRSWFSPELVNRLDKVVVFNELTADDLSAIVSQKLTELTTRLTTKRITLRVTPRATKHLVEKVQKNSSGARAIRQIIEQEIEGLIADTLVASIKSPSALKLDLNKGILTCAPPSK